MSDKKAVALSWTGSEEAPVIIASGRNEVAKRMLEIAETCGIKTVTDPFLADIMYSSEIGTCIPEETWGAVASIFAFLEKGIQERWFTQKVDR